MASPYETRRGVNGLVPAKQTQSTMTPQQTEKSWEKQVAAENALTKQRTKKVLPGMTTYTGKLKDGQAIAPEFQTLLGKNGTLGSQYALNDDFKRQDLNVDAMNRLRTDALRDPGTQSPWAKAQSDLMESQKAQQIDQLQASQNSGMVNAFDQMASQGGLSSGSRERMGRSSIRDMLNARQQTNQNFNQQGFQLATQDEANRVGQLGQVQTMANQQAQFNQGERDAQMRVQDVDIGRALGEVDKGRESAMETYKTDQAVWGANKTANAQQAANGKGGCCFIFLEARYGDGSMDSVVRRFRDENMTDRNKRGYYKLSEVLVPLMRKSKLVKFFVRVSMTDPLVSYGKYHYGEGKLGRIFTPIKNFWLKAFDYLGQDHKFIRENGEEI